MNIEELKSLKVTMARVEKDLAAYADKHPAIKLLMTTPGGVGIRTAETFLAWVDDITRFRRTSRLGCYFGPVPCQDTPAPDKDRLGHITRDGAHR